MQPSPVDPSRAAPAADREPTPEPRSTVQRVLDDDIPPHLLGDPFVRYMMDPPAEDMANHEARIEAGEIYGDDHERAYQDLLAGRHPLQRARSSSR
jgi:hypothetical protein